jgi:ADP-heptose:LPS heptosyltransferase
LNQFLNNPCNISHSNIPGLYGLTKIGELSDELKALLQPNKYNLVLHPKSNTNGREWGLDKYSELFRELPVDYFNIIVTGTESEAREMEQLLKVYKNRIVDLTGKISLNEFISLISASDGFVGCSSGPLHIASATGINAIGIYSPLKNISPERFAPLGKNATYLVKEINCNKCKNTEHCECMSSISASNVIEKLRHFYHQKFWSHGA